MLVLFSIYFITKWVLILIWKLGPKAWGFRTGLGVCHGAWLPGSTPIVVSSPHHRVTVVSPHLVRLKRSQTRWCRRLGGVDDGKKPGSQSWLPGMPSLARCGATPIPRNGLN